MPPLCDFLIKPGASEHWGSIELVVNEIPRFGFPGLDKLGTPFSSLGRRRKNVFTVATADGEAGRAAENAPPFAEKIKTIYGVDSSPLSSKLKGGYRVPWRIPQKHAGFDVDVYLTTPKKGIRYQNSSEYLLDFHYIGDSTESSIVCSLGFELTAYSSIVNAPWGAGRTRGWSSPSNWARSLGINVKWIPNWNHYHTAIHVTTKGVTETDTAIGKTRGIATQELGRTGYELAAAYPWSALSAKQSVSQTVGFGFSPEETRKRGSRVFTLFIDQIHFNRVQGSKRRGSAGKWRDPTGLLGYEFFIRPFITPYKKPPERMKLTVGPRTFPASKPGTVPYWKKTDIPG